MLTGMLMPSSAATPYVSSIMARTTARASTSAAISARLALVSALTGLKALLPSSFTQISSRMFERIGARSPARPMAADSARARSDVEPSSSPIEKRSPSVCSMTPGSTMATAG